MFATYSFKTSPFVFGSESGSGSGNDTSGGTGTITGTGSGSESGSGSGNDTSGGTGTITGTGSGSESGSGSGSDTSGGTGSSGGTGTSGGLGSGSGSSGRGYDGGSVGLAHVVACLEREDFGVWNLSSNDPELIKVVELIKVLKHWPAAETPDPPSDCGTVEVRRFVGELREAVADQSPLAEGLTAFWTRVGSVVKRLMDAVYGDDRPAEAASGIARPAWGMVG